jgi:hypothetical protein
VDAGSHAWTWRECGQCAVVTRELCRFDDGHMDWGYGPVDVVEWLQDYSADMVEAFLNGWLTEDGGRWPVDLVEAAFAWGDTPQPGQADDPPEPCHEGPDLDAEDSQWAAEWEAMAAADPQTVAIQERMTNPPRMTINPHVNSGRPYLHGGWATHMAYCSRCGFDTMRPTLGPAWPYGSS